MTRAQFKTSRTFAADSRANVAIMFGLAVVPLTLFAGAAIDYTRAASLRARLQHAADSAVLAAALSPSGTPSGAQSAGEAAFRANFPEGGTVAISLPCGRAPHSGGRGRGRPASSIATKVKVASVTLTRSPMRNRLHQASTWIFIDVRPTLSTSV